MKRRTVFVGIVCFAILLLCCYLQFGREMEVYNSTSFTVANYYEEHLNVVVNSLMVLDKRKVAEEIIEHCRKNDFRNIFFTYDVAYPNKLEVSVYLSEWNTRRGKAVFLFVYDTEQGEIGEYNFIENPEKFMLKMKSGVFNAGIGEQEYNAYKNLFLL